MDYELPTKIGYPVVDFASDSSEFTFEGPMCELLGEIKALRAELAESRPAVGVDPAIGKDVSVFSVRCACDGLCAHSAPMEDWVDPDLLKHVRHREHPALPGVPWCGSQNAEDTILCASQGNTNCPRCLTLLAGKNAVDATLVSMAQKVNKLCAERESIGIANIIDTCPECSGISPKPWCRCKGTGVVS